MNVTKLSDHRKDRERRLQAQEERAQAALLVASIEFRKLAALRAELGDRNDPVTQWFTELEEHDSH